MAIRSIFPGVFHSIQKHFLIPVSRQEKRFVSSIEEASAICNCGLTLPKASEIARLFEQRNLREVSKLTSCNKTKNYSFKEQKACALAMELDRVASFSLSELKDVVYVGEGSFAMLSALKPLPESLLGDLTGDHGRQISMFLKACYENRLIPQIGSVID